jgi:stearoyl-CoA desaturase (delta-9 desaturase)
VTVPLVGFAVAVVLLWARGFWWVDLGLLAGMYLLTLLGITVGFHRLFTHRSFRAGRPVQLLLGVLGSMAFQGGLLGWVGRHRLHHRHSDRVGDPHSPHAHPRGTRSRLRRFWYSHVGWGFAPAPPDLARYAGDLARSRLLRVVDTLFPLWAALGLLAPAVIGYACGGWPGALTGFLWGGLVRVLLVHHVTWSVNSVCHLWGSRPYPGKDESRNNLVFGVLALGEGWHNNHHAFPTSARHGLEWWQFDFSYAVIRVLALVGLAWEVRLPRRPPADDGDRQAGLIGRDSL